MLKVSKKADAKADVKSGAKAGAKAAGVKGGKAGRKIDVKKMLPLLVVVFIAVIAYALYSMDMLPFLSGGGDDQATAPTVRTAAQASTATGAKKPSTTSTAKPASPEEQAAQYVADLQAWQTKNWGDIDAGAFTFKKAYAPTKAEIARAQAAADKQPAALEALDSIMAPEDLAADHARYVAIIEAETRATQRLLAAVKNKNGRDIVLAVRDLSDAHAIEGQTIAAINDLLAQSTPTTESFTKK